MRPDRPRDLVSNSEQSNRSDGEEVMSILPLASEVSGLCCGGGCCGDLGSNQREGTLTDTQDPETKS
jgi:hypothetical protein